MTRLAEEWAIFLLAVQFMTRLPVRPAGWSSERMAASPRWYPAVGVLVGGTAAFVYGGANLVFPTILAVLLSTVAAVVLTGALHEDGLADCCDGLGGAASMDRALEIMRDSRIGVYGALGLGLLMAVKVASLTGLPAWAVPSALVAAHATSRSSAVLVMATSRYVRDQGAGTPVAGGTGVLLPALIMGALACLPLLAQAPVAAACGLFGLAIGHGVMRRVFDRRLGGYTGDCLGAVQQLSEVGFYLGVLAVLGLG
ncbi:MAG: adenosylcobinamide-GDP ribazoletransferase [Pseudomonadota bacterium]